MTQASGIKFAVLVEFFAQQGGVAGRSSSFKKIGFISRDYIGNKPEPKSKWWCVRQFETKPEDPRKGVQILIPMRPQTHACESPPVIDESKLLMKRAPSRKPTHLGQRSKAERAAGQTPAPASQRPFQGKTLSLPGTSPAKGKRVVIVVQQEKKKNKKKQQPAVIVDPRKRSYVVEQHEVGSDQRIEVIETIAMEGLEVGKHTFAVLTHSDVKEHWPKDVRRDVRGRLALIILAKEEAARKRRDELIRRLREERLQREAEAEQKAAVAKQARETKRDEAEATREERKFYVAGLTNPFDVTITGIEPVQHHLRLVPVSVARSIYRVYVDNVDTGIFDYSSDVRFGEFPCTIDGIKVTLSDGRSFTVYAKDLRVFKTEDNDRRKEVFRTECALSYAHKDLMRWRDVESAAVGDLFTTEYSFQWAGNWLTNGEYWFPKERPEGAAEWRKLPVSSIPAELYDDYLIGLDGKRLVDLLDFDGEVRKAAKKAAKEPRLTDEQKRFYAVATGKMWNPKEGCKDITIVKQTGAVIFHLRPDLHVLDNPGKGAMYFFRDRKHAEKVAQGTLKRSEAMHMYPRILHIDGWEEEVRKVLTDPAAEAALFASVEVEVSTAAVAQAAAVELAAVA